MTICKIKRNEKCIFFAKELMPFYIYSFICPETNNMAYGR